MSGMDRISMLPDHILEKIFLLLPWEDAARMTVISRTWRNFWAMFRTFNFIFEQSPNPWVPWCKKHIEETLEFVKYVDQEVLGIRPEKAIIQMFRLCITTIDCRIASRLDDLIQLVNTNCIKGLDLEICQIITFYYCLPLSPFAVTSLEFLKVKGCKLEKPVFSVGRDFCSLREVSLSNVDLDDETLHDIIIGCPSLESFALIKCRKIKVIEIPCLPKLTNVLVHGFGEIKTVTIDAINLQRFCFRGHCRWLSISIAPLKCLRELEIEDFYFRDNSLEDLLSKLLLLKCLALTRCLGVRATISHSSLESLVLVHINGQFLDIETPILRSFEYTCADPPEQFFINAPCLQESRLIIDTKPQCSYLDTDWFRSFRDYLLKFDQHNNIILYLPFESVTFIPNDRNDIVIPPLTVVKQLDLVDFVYPSSHQALLDALFWSCHPEILVIPHASKDTTTFIRFLCEKLIDRVEDPLCCTNSRIRCWRHFLRHVRTDSFTTIEDREALLSSLPECVGPDPRLEISFRLQWI